MQRVERYYFLGMQGSSGSKKFVGLMISVKGDSRGWGFFNRMLPHMFVNTKWRPGNAV
jgi:hypothetical protein